MKSSHTANLTFVTTFSRSPICISYFHCVHLHWASSVLLWRVPFDKYGALTPLLFWPLNNEEGLSVRLELFIIGRTHVLFGWARRKLSENWLNPINNAGIHVRTMSCFWYFPNPPRNGKTQPSMRDSKAGEVVSGDTKPFSGWWSSVSSWATAIAVSHIEASLCSAAGLAVQPVDSTMRQCPRTGERCAQSARQF